MPAAAAQKVRAFALISVTGMIQDSNSIMMTVGYVPGRTRACVLRGKEDRSNLTAAVAQRVKR